MISTAEVNASNSVENTNWNSTSQQGYAPLFPYIALEQKVLNNILNVTMSRAETMKSIFGNTTTSFRPNYDLTADDTLNNDSCSASQDNESAWFSVQFQATLHFMYITIFLIAVCGNGIVCFIVCTSTRMQTVTNYFIANLALSDMLMAFFCIPFSFISLFVLQ